MRCEHTEEGFCVSCAAYLIVKLDEMERRFLVNTAKVEAIERMMQAACGWAFDLGRG